MTDSAAALTETQMQTLSALANAIIPRSDKYAAPGAGDPAICQAILADAGGRRGRIEAALATLDDMARARHGATFATLDDRDRQAVADAFRADHAALADTIANLTTQCYYRDERVMISLGMEPRPPHPKGYEIPEGDWSLLDPVRRRAPLYRRTD